jgi:hypothetical protein
VLVKSKQRTQEDLSTGERKSLGVRTGVGASAQESVPTEPWPWTTPSNATCSAPGTPADIASSVATENVQSNSGGTATDARQTLNRPHFALWRNDDTVRAAMRLRDPEQQASGVIATLRSWLRDAGLTLTRVLVNGHSHQSDQEK